MTAQIIKFPSERCRKPKRISEGNAEQRREALEARNRCEQHTNALRDLYERLESAGPGEYVMVPSFAIKNGTLLLTERMVIE